MDLLDREFDDFSGIVEETYYDESTDRLIIKRIADVEPHLDANKDAFNSYKKPTYRSETMNHVASIPNIIIEKWMKEEPPLNIYNPQHKKRLLQRLNDPEWKYLRTMPGRI